MSLCIYCLEEKTRMNREHVIPECYGTFANNLVLHDTLCEECNQYFGDNIDLFLGRDTIEGIERFKHGLKSSGKVRRERIKFRIDQGRLKGMIAEPMPSQNAGEIDIDPVMQIGFFNNITQVYDYFEPKDIPSTAELTAGGYELKDNTKPTHIVAKDDNGIKYVLACLKDKGINIKVEGDADWPEEVKTRAKILVEGEIRVDALIFRGMAKIAFNYLAYTAGKNFVIEPSFNPIRSFIRYGVGSPREFCDVNRRPILHEEKKFGVRFTTGHLIIIEWQGPSVISRVSIFNLNTYHIRICKYFRGLFRDIRSGHHFDVNERNVSKLGHVSKRIII